MFYNYTCENGCRVNKLTKSERKQLSIEPHPKKILVWTVQHGMTEQPDIKCPVCGRNAIRSWHGVDISGYIRGNCYLNREDCKRQMDLRLLESGNDPYKHMRQPGEVDDLKKRLKKKRTKR